MSLDKRDIEMITISVPTVDYWDMREELGRLEDTVDRLWDTVDRLEKTVGALIELYRVERVKNWEMILHKMMEKQLKKGNWNDSHR